MNVARSRTSRLFAVLAAAVALAACGDADDADVADADADAVGAGGTPAAIEGEWIAIAGTVDDTPVTLLPAGPITLEIVDQPDGALQISGRAACNSYDGTASFGSDGGVSFGDLAITEMGCVDTGVMELEQTYVGTLAGLDGWTLDGDVLVLTGGGAEWRFERSMPTPTVDVFGVTWVLDSHVDGGIASNAVGFDAVVLRLSDDGSFEGATGCSGIEGRWEERDDGAGVASAELIETSGGCVDGAQALSDVVADVLDRSPSIVVDGDRLRLATGDGDALVFRAVEDAPAVADEAADESSAPVALSPVSVRPVLACGEAALTADADIIQVDPAQQLDCALGPPISDEPVFAADAEAVPGPTGQWQVSVRIAPDARPAWDAAAADCFERRAECPTGQLAIVANGAIASAPMVQTPTFPGELVISGAFTESDARSIALAINANS